MFCSFKSRRQSKHLHRKEEMQKAPQELKKRPSLTLLFSGHFNWHDLLFSTVRNFNNKKELISSYSINHRSSDLISPLSLSLCLSLSWSAKKQNVSSVLGSGGFLFNSKNWLVQSFVTKLGCIIRA